VDKVQSDSIYKVLPGGQEGLLSGAGARDYLLESGLSPVVLRQIWDLSDVDKDGYLSPEEFAVRFVKVLDFFALNLLLFLLSVSHIFTYTRCTIFRPFSYAAI
jgi:hypothetical protein